MPAEPESSQASYRGLVDGEDKIVWRGPVPAYLQVADFLRRRIQRGSLGPDDRLPSESELIEIYGVGRKTARSAIRVLRDEGLVYTVEHRGSYVRGPAA
jgi:DNA-binding GntR family transcriptional regulator